MLFVVFLVCGGLLGECVAVWFVCLLLWLTVVGCAGLVCFGFWVLVLGLVGVMLWGGWLIIICFGFSWWYAVGVGF